MLSRFFPVYFDFRLLDRFLSLGLMPKAQCPKPFFPLMSKRKTVLPGHMKKTIERVEELASAVDIVFEVVDARAPLSSRCHILNRILAGSFHVTVLSKIDLADRMVTRSWERHFEGGGMPWKELPFGKVRPADFFNFPALPRAPGAMLKALAIGIPNVGKSTLINLLVGKHSAPVAARPGVTRGLQLLKAGDGIFIYDTPGVINPVIKSENHAHVLGLIGCLQDQFFDSEGAALHLADRILAAGAEKTFESCYDLKLHAGCGNVGMLEELARRRGFLLKGGEPDFGRACRLLVTDFSTGRLRGISLETPPEDKAPLL